MSETFVLYFWLGCVLGLMAWPIYSIINESMDPKGLVICGSIPLLVVIVMLLGTSPARAASTLEPAVSSVFSMQKPPAGQIAGPYSHWFPYGQTGWVLDIPDKPSVSASSGANGGAVNVGTRGTAVVVRPNNTPIRVPVAINTRIPASAAAAAAARAAGAAARALGPVGAAWTGWAIYKEVKDSGIHICPPPDFFCFPPTNEYDRDQLGWTWLQLNYKGSLNQIENHMTKTYCPGCKIENVNDITQPGGEPTLSYRVKSTDGGYFSWSVRFTGPGVNSKEKPGPPMSESDMAGKMGARAGADSSGQTASNMYGAARDADANMRQQGEAGVPPSVMQPPASSTTTVTSGPVTGPVEALGSKTVTNPDGSTTTTTTTGQPTITPTTTGNGSSTVITYNYNYNITNVSQTGNNPPVTNTEVIIVRVEPEPAPSSPTPTPIEFPKDYNKEATQLRIENLLKGEGMPDGSALSSQEAETEMKGAQATGKAAIDGITPESVGLVSWLPSVPTAQCVNPTVTNPATGGQEEFNMCEPVNLFSKFISAVICVFVLYGCVREVQAAIAT